MYRSSRSIYFGDELFSKGQRLVDEWLLNIFEVSVHDVVFVESVD